MNDDAWRWKNPPLSQAQRVPGTSRAEINTKAAIGFAERRVKDVIVPAQPSQQWVIEA